MVSKPTGRPPGRPRKPVALKILHGDTVPRGAAPKVHGPVTRPDGLSTAAGAVWDSLAPPLLASGVVSAADVPLLSEFCEVLVMARMFRAVVMADLAFPDPETGPSGAATLNYSRAMTLVLNIASRFGLSPADRAKLVLGEVGRGATDDLLSG